MGKKGKISFSAQTKLKDVTTKNTRYVTDAQKRFKSVNAVEQDYIQDYTRTVRRGKKLITQGKWVLGAPKRAMKEAKDKKDRATKEKKKIKEKLRKMRAKAKGKLKKKAKSKLKGKVKKATEKVVKKANEKLKKAKVKGKLKVKGKVKLVENKEANEKKK